MSDGMICPHCGINVDLQKDGLTVNHFYNGKACPGSQQNPRYGPSDKRPLWKDGGVK